MVKDNSIIYISGPMTGLENYNRERFNSLAGDLKEAGFEVVNPVDIHFAVFGERDVLSKASYNTLLEIELKAIETCSSIYMLKGWQTSNGAKLELKKAIECGLEIILE